MTIRYLLCVGLTLVTGVCGAESLEIDAAASHDTLTRGRADWRSETLRLTRRGENHQAVYVGAGETERFGLRDQQFLAGGTLAVGKDSHFSAELGASGTHRILAKDYVDLNWHQSLGQGWGAEVGGRRSAYAIGNAALVRLGVERYVGQERFAYTLFNGGPQGKSSASSHRLQWSHFYGDQDFVGVAVFRGKEVENVGESVLSTWQVSGVALNGRHDLSPRWSVIWDAVSVRQGDLYRRTGAQLGLRYRF